RNGPYSGGQVQENTAFFAATVDLRAPFAGEIFSENAQVTGLQMGEWTALNLPRGVKAQAGPGTRIEFSGLSVMTRIDVSSPLRPADVSLFAPRLERKSGAQEPAMVDDFN